MTAAPKKMLRSFARFVADRYWDIASDAWRDAELLRCSIVSLIMCCGQSGEIYARQDVERRAAAFREHQFDWRG